MLPLKISDENKKVQTKNISGEISVCKNVRIAHILMINTGLESRFWFVTCRECPVGNQRFV